VNVENLKNYGRPFSDTMTTLPAAVQNMIRRESAKVIRSHLGVVGLLRLLLLSWRERRRMLQADLEFVRGKGLTNQKFIDMMVGQTAMFSATAKLAGMDRALSIFREIMDRVAIPLNEALQPSRSELGQVGDPFAAFRKYLLAFFEAENRAGLHEYRVVEDSGDAIAVDVTYCAFCEIPKRLGVMEACESGCYSDEVFFPGYLEPLGVRFVRTQTLARKGDCCDFRYERVRGSD